MQDWNSRGGGILGPKIRSRAADQDTWEWAQIKRILIIRIDFLGDMLCTTPLLHALKERWPAAEIHVLGNRRNLPLLERNPDVACCHSYVYSRQFERNPRPGWFNALRDRLALAWRLRRLRFDLLVVPNGGMSKSAVRFASQLGVADRRWHTRASEFDDRVSAHVAGRPLRHEALAGFALLPELGQVQAEALRLYAYPDPGLRALWRARLGSWRRPRVGLFISNKSAARRWPFLCWSELAARLGELAEALIFQDPDEPPVAATKRLATASLPDLVAAMSELDLVVSADSLPVHLAAALRIPVVALFEGRPEKYLRWYPLGVDHQLLHAGPRVDSITVGSVERAVSSLLAAQLRPALRAS